MWKTALAIGCLLGAGSGISLPAANCGHWTDLAAVGLGPRQEHSTTSTNSEILIIGGIPSNASNTELVIGSTDIVERYCIRTNTWKNATPLPIKVTHANSATVDGKVYVLGALVGNGSDHTWRATADCFVYNPDADSWSALPAMPASQARGASAIGVLGKVIYLAGGLKSLDYLGGLQASVDVVTSYNVETGEWATLPSIPAPRDHVGGMVIGEEFYVVGGRNNRVVANTTWSLDLSRPGRATWVARSQMPTARGGLCIGAIGDLIFTFGGEENPDPGSKGVFNNTEMYNTRTNKWTKLAPMKHPRHGTVATTVGDRIYIPGGGVQQGAAPVDTFDYFSL